MTEWVHADCHIGPLHFASETHCLQHSSRPRQPRLAGRLATLPSVGRHWRLSAVSSQRNRFVEGMGIHFHLTGEALEWRLFLPVYSEGNNRSVRWVPPSPRSFGIIELGGNSRKIFEFKGVIWKIFRNKELRAKKPAASPLLTLHRHCTPTPFPRFTPLPPASGHQNEGRDRWPRPDPS